MVEIDWHHLPDTLPASAPAKQPRWTLSRVNPKLQLEFIDWQSRDYKWNENEPQVRQPKAPATL